MRKLISETSIKNRITEMASEIDDYYNKQDWYINTKEPVLVMGVLTGAIFFMADLVRKLSIRVELDFIRVSTYPDGETIPQEPKIITSPTRQLYDSNVLLVDDILDTGRTLEVVRKYMRWPCPASVQTAVLLRKPNKVSSYITANFVGFDIPDEFVIGYGLDYDCLYREMPYVAVWSENEHRASKSKIG